MSTHLETLAKVVSSKLDVISIKDRAAVFSIRGMRKKDLKKFHLDNGDIKLSNYFHILWTLGYEVKINIRVFGEEK